MRAVRFWMAAFATGAVAPKPRPATPDVVDDSGIGDDLVILTPEGAAYLAEQREQAEAGHADGLREAVPDLPRPGLPGRPGAALAGLLPPPARGRVLMNGMYWDPAPDWIDEPEDDDALMIVGDAGLVVALTRADDDSDDA